MKVVDSKPCCRCGTIGTKEIKKGLKRSNRITTGVHLQVCFRCLAIELWAAVANFSNRSASFLPYQSNSLCAELLYTYNLRHLHIYHEASRCVRARGLVRAFTTCWPGTYVSMLVSSRPFVCITEVREDDVSHISSEPDAKQHLRSRSLLGLR